MSIFTCPLCGDQIDSDTDDSVEHPLTQELICSDCADFIECESFPFIASTTKDK